MAGTQLSPGLLATVPGELSSMEEQRQRNLRPRRSQLLHPPLPRGGLLPAVHPCIGASTTPLGEPFFQPDRPLVIGMLYARSQPTQSEDSSDVIQVSASPQLMADRAGVRKVFPRSQSSMACLISLSPCVPFCPAICRGWHPSILMLTLRARGVSNSFPTGQMVAAMSRTDLRDRPHPMVLRADRYCLSH